jgi:tRNA threonylcarbamoyladenosine biosynthesis protein TsaB
MTIFFMILYIDTTDFGAITYALVGGKTIKKTYRVDPRHSHEVLGYLEKFFKKIDRSTITKIIVNKGPGSYTGTRIGVTHALALGFAWNVPVKALDGEKFLEQLEKVK